MKQDSTAIITLVTLFVIHLTTTIAQECFFPDGSAAEDFIPCNSSTSATTCCVKGAGCLSSQLCYEADDMSINTGACTDKSWKDEHCFQKCPGGTFALALLPDRASNTLYLFMLGLRQGCMASGTLTHLPSLVAHFQPSYFHASLDS